MKAQHIQTAALLTIAVCAVVLTLFFTIPSVKNAIKSKEKPWEERLKELENKLFQVEWRTDPIDKWSDGEDHEIVRMEKIELSFNTLRQEVNVDITPIPDAIVNLTGSSAFELRYKGSRWRLGHAKFRDDSGKIQDRIALYLDHLPKN